MTEDSQKKRDRRVPREYECPVCNGSGSLCNNPNYDEDYCPEGHDCCAGDCGSIVPCDYCAGEGMVTFAKMNRHAKKMAKILWGINAPKDHAKAQSGS